jgi:hypothetical protein
MINYLLLEQTMLVKANIDLQVKCVAAGEDASVDIDSENARLVRRVTFRVISYFFISIKP